MTTQLSVSHLVWQWCVTLFYSATCVLSTIFLFMVDVVPAWLRILSMALAVIAVVLHVATAVLWTLMFLNREPDAETAGIVSEF